MGYWNFQGKSSKCFNGLQLYSVELLFLAVPHQTETGLTGTLSLSGFIWDPEFTQCLPFFSSFFMSLSFSTLWGSLSHSCMRTKGSRPFRLSLCQGFGRDSRSDTEPCVSPRMLSPNSRCPGDRGGGQPVTPRLGRGAPRRCKK